MIKIDYGKEYGDATAEYLIKTDNITVGEFIEEWLADRNDWGYFGIKDRKTIFGNPCCEYKYGKIITEPLPKEYLCKKIKKIYGSGGWSRSDFLFEVEEE